MMRIVPSRTRTRRRPTTRPPCTPRSCSTIVVSLVGEKNSIRWNDEIGAPVRPLRVTRRLSASAGRSSETAVNTTRGSAPGATRRCSYCHTAQPRSSPRTWNTNESLASPRAAMANRSGLAPPRAAGGALWATAALASRKQSQRIRLENSGPLWVGEGELEELVDVLPQVLHSGARPIRPPQRAVGELRQAGKVLQQLGGRDPPYIEADVPVTAEDEERLLHVQRPAAVRHDDAQVGEVDRDVVELHRAAVLVARPGEDRRSGVYHHRQAPLLAAPVDRAQGIQPLGVRVGREQLVRGMDLEQPDAQIDQAIHVARGVAAVARVPAAVGEESLGVGPA